ncbi:MFS transporter small subunit [Reyranella sp.]|uniref:MFS transporter small subunit n=1 Tax=Reyranella sp. TaxID=1929291 RepID=UPI004036AE58
MAALQARIQAALVVPHGSMGIGRWQLNATSILAWLVVGIPITWGVWITLKSAFVLFN